MVSSRRPGALGWALAVDADSSYQQGWGVGADGSGNTYVTGGFEGAVVLGAGEPNETSLTAAEAGALFLAKYAAPVSMPVAQITALSEDVSAEGLPRGLERSLTRKPNQSLRFIERDRDNIAIRRLGAFGRQVERQSGRRIDEDVADEWISESEAIIAELEG